MSNKIQLQENNLNLQGIIDIIQELPEAIPDELGNAITTDVLIGKTFTSDSGIMQQGGLDPETLKTGIYVWKKLTAEGGDFVDFVVNDTETAYPDGGMQEGYWYEKFNPVTLIANNIRKDVDIWGIVGTLVEGKAGIDFGTVTLSSSQSRVTVTHNLGKKPSFFLILIPNDQTSMRMGYYWNYYGYDHEGLSRKLYYTIPTGDTSTSNTLTFYDLDRNNTYYWFAIA